MSTKTDEETKSNSSAQPEDSEESEGGLGPALLAGAGILVVVAALVFWPTDEGTAGKDGSGANGKSAAAAQGRAGGGGPGAKGAGGIDPRGADDPARRDPGAHADGSKPRLNPAVRLPRGMGLAPAVPPEEPPPKFETKEEEIAWYQTKLDKANTHLEMRKKATQRLERMRKKADASDDAEQALARYDQRAEIVNENYRKAQKKVDDLEEKLAELRGE